MKANRSGRAGGADDAGVATVLGAILMFGLLILTLVMIRVRFVPVWDEDAEAAHMREVRGQFALLASDLGRQAANSTSAAFTHPLTLERQSGFSFFAGAQVPGTVSFNGDATDLTLSSPHLRLLESGGRALYALSGAWTPIGGSASTDDLLNVGLVRALRLRVDMHLGVCRDYHAQDSATLVVNDSSGAMAARTVVTWLPASSSEYAIKLDLYGNFDGGAVADDQVSSDTELFNNQICQGSQSNNLDYIYFDLLDPSLQFDSLLATAAKPLDLHMVETGLQADYQVAYDTAPSAGGVTTVGGGILDPSWGDPLNHRYAAGLLRFDAGNQRFVRQSYVLEHGAVLLHQADGDVMLVPPSLRVAGGTAVATLDWTLPSLNAATQTLAGSHSGTVLTTRSGPDTNLRALATRLVVELPTAFPAAWTSFLDQAFTEAGFTPGVQYTLSSTAAGVTLSVVGPDPSDAGDDTHNDVVFVFRQADVVVRLQSGG